MATTPMTDLTTGPLGGKRIIDLSERSPAALLAGMMFADLGAEVIRIEPEGGDPVRALNGSETWLRGQKSVTVDADALTSGAWLRLRDSADILIDTVQPWSQKPEGLLDGWDDTSGQILTLLTAEPQSAHDALTRPRHLQAPAYSEWVEARYDFMNIQTGYRSGPIYTGWPLSVFGAACQLVSASLAALYHQTVTGHGQIATCSLLEGALGMSVGQWWGNKSPAKPAPPPAIASPSLSLLRCADERYIFIFLLTRETLNKVLDITGSHVDIDPKASILMLSKDPAQYLPIREALQAKIATQPAEYWREKISAADVPCVIAHAPGEVYEVEQPVANGLVQTLPDGRKRFGRMAKFQRTPMTIAERSPHTGEDNHLLTEPAVTRPVPPVSTEPRARPLEGLTVLDLGAFIAGPYSSRLYAELGARVIKVEELTGEKMRHAGTLFYPFHPSNRGKESIAVDLKTEEGRRIVHELVRRADIVHHNVREQALGRMGIDYPTLSALNPRLIYCHSTGFGNEGPWAKHPSFEYCQSAFAGMLHRSGGDDNVPALYSGNMDWGQGLLAAAMVLAALQERETSGKGQYIEVPHTSAALLCMSDVVTQNGKVSESFPLDKAQRGHAASNALYQTNDGWLLLSCYSEPEWQGVRQAFNIASEDWDTFAATRATGLSAHPASARLDTVLADMSSFEAERRLSAAGVTCLIVPPFSRARLAEEAAYRRLGVTVVEDIPAGGTYWELGNLQRFSLSDGLQPLPGPALGNYTNAILQELGFSAPDRTDLIARNIVVAGS